MYKKVKVLSSEGPMWCEYWKSESFEDGSIQCLNLHLLDLRNPYVAYWLSSRSLTSEEFQELSLRPLPVQSWARARQKHQVPCLRHLEDLKKL